MEDDKELIQEILSEAVSVGREVDIVYAALVALQNTPSLSIRESIQKGYDSCIL